MTNEEAIEILQKIKSIPHRGDGKSTTHILETIALDMAIKALEQQPNTGYWISHREHCENLGVMPSGLGAYVWCSNCDCGIDVREWHRNPYNYCPKCGADMSEV